MAPPKTLEGTHASERHWSLIISFMGGAIAVYSTCGNYRKRTVPQIRKVLERQNDRWPLHPDPLQSHPAAVGSWRTLFIIKPVASDSQVVFNSDELCWTSRGLCWPLRPRPEQTLVSALSIFLQMPSSIILGPPLWEGSFSQAWRCLELLSDPQEWKTRVTQSSSKGNGSNSVKVHLRFCISFDVSLISKEK